VTRAEEAVEEAEAEVAAARKAMKGDGAGPAVAALLLVPLLAGLAAVAGGLI